MNRGYMGKAMVVSIDKLTAVKMYYKVKEQWGKYIERLKDKLKTASDVEANILKVKIRYMQETDMAVIVSSAQNEVDDFRKKGFDILPLRKECKQRI